MSCILAPMRLFSITPARLAIVLALPLASCAEDPSVMVEVQLGDLAVPGDVDSLCLGIWDSDPDGGNFGNRYLLASGAAATLAVEPGTAREAVLEARVHRQGLEVASTRRPLDFSADVSVSLDRCRPGASSASSERDAQSVPENSALVVSAGGARPWIVTVADGAGLVFEAGDTGLTSVPVASPEGDGPVLAAIAVDIDEDCDDDILVLESAGPRLWRREQDGFVVADERRPAGASPASSAAVLDVDGDLRHDLALVGPAGLEVWLGGEEGFTLVANAAGTADLADATALAVADLDEDGHLDLAVARAGAAGQNDRVLYGDSSGHFELEPLALPALPTRSQGVVVADIDGDGVAEIITAGSNEPVRAYQRDGARHYIERSRELLPDSAAVDARGLSQGDWSGDCEPDLLVPAAPTLSWSSRSGALAAEAALAGSRQALLADVLGTGGLDLLLLDATALRWFRR